MDCDLFYSRCLIRGKEYEFCIDHDEEATLVSTALVNELDLPLYRHPHPYYKKFSGRRVHVISQARVYIDLNGYKCVMLCDVFPMQGESIVLGQQWLHEYKVRYDSSRAWYSFYGMGMKYVLASRKVVHVDNLVQDWLDKSRKVFEDCLQDFPKRVMENYKQRCAELDAEKTLREAKNTHSMEPCASMEDVIFISAELTCPTMEEVVPKDEAVVNVRVVNDVDSHATHFMEVDTIEEEFKCKESTLVVEMENSRRSDIVDVLVEDAQSDFLSLSTCSSPISSPLQVPLEPLLEGDIGLLDTPHAAHVLPSDVLDIVDIGGKPEHTLDDPYLAYVAVNPDLCLFDYQDTSHGFNHIYIMPQDCYEVPFVKYGADTSYVADARLFIRVLFDPGISLVFILCSHEVVHDGALFYDILLIRGRILSNREGMIHIMEAQISILKMMQVRIHFRFKKDQ